MLQRQHGQLDPGVDVELEVHVLQVGVHGVTREVELRGDSAVGHARSDTGHDAQLAVGERPPPSVQVLVALQTHADHGVPARLGDAGRVVLRRRQVVGVVDHRAVQQDLGVRLEHLDEHLRTEFLEVIEADEDGGHLLDHAVEGRLVDEQVVPAGNAGKHPRHVASRSEKAEVVCDRCIHSLRQETHHARDAELPRMEVGVRRAFDVELRRSTRVVGAGLPDGSVPDQRRLDVVDQAQTLVAVPEPLLEEGIQQPVALGWTRVERAEMSSRTHSADPRDPETQTVHARHRSMGRMDESHRSASGTGRNPMPGSAG